MRQRLHLSRGVLAAVFVAALAGGAGAQTGRVGGTVKDETGQPLKGATITADNPNASPSSFTATTDDKGRFSIIGLKSGSWTFTAQAPGFGPESGKLQVQTIGAPNPPLTFTLKKGAGGAAAGALGGLAAKDLQSELATADQLYNTQKFDEAIAMYRGIMAKAPSLSVINLQIAAAYRNKKEYDNAIAAYADLLKVDPGNDKAIIGIGMTNLEKGDLKAAEETLTKAAENSRATREVFYNLGEVKFSKGDTEAAGKNYQRAAEMDPTWMKPVFKLALVAYNKQDMGTAKALMEKVASDPQCASVVNADRTTTINSGTVAGSTTSETSTNVNIAANCADAVAAKQFLQQLK
jgi:Flp pilus assembly protein TadD